MRPHACGRPVRVDHGGPVPVDHGGPGGLGVITEDSEGPGCCRVVSLPARPAGVALFPGGPRGPHQPSLIAGTGLPRGRGASRAPMSQIMRLSKENLPSVRVVHAMTCTTRTADQRPVPRRARLTFHDHELTASLASTIFRDHGKPTRSSVILGAGGAGGQAGGQYSRGDWRVAGPHFHTAGGDFGLTSAAEALLAPDGVTKIGCVLGTHHHGRGGAPVLRVDEAADAAPDVPARQFAGVGPPVRNLVIRHGSSIGHIALTALHALGAS